MCRKQFEDNNKIDLGGNRVSFFFLILKVTHIMQGDNDMVGRAHSFSSQRGNPQLNKVRASKLAYISYT